MVAVITQVLAKLQRQHEAQSHTRLIRQKDYIAHAYQLCIVTYNYNAYSIPPS